MNATPLQPTVPTPHTHAGTLTLPHTHTPAYPHATPLQPTAHTTLSHAGMTHRYSPHAPHHTHVCPNATTHNPNTHTRTHTYTHTYTHTHIWSHNHVRSHTHTLTVKHTHQYSPQLICLSCTIRYRPYVAPDFSQRPTDEEVDAAYTTWCVWNNPSTAESPIASMLAAPTL